MTAQQEGGTTPAGMVLVPCEPPEAVLDWAPNYMMSRASMAILWRDLLAAAALARSDASEGGGK